MSSEAASTSGSTGDPLALKIHITGRGNFDRVLTNGLPASAEWKTYKPRAHFEPADSSNTRGAKTFEQSIVPLKAGAQEIPALRFSYFDPESQSYVTKTTSVFFAFEQQHNPACGACLAPFDFDYQELTGLTTCAAPFVDATCDHITACLVDCTDQSCAKCSDSGALQACETQVPAGVCAPYYNGAQCIGQAFFGQGSFCDPNQGTGLFGDWLSSVGQFYCAK